jgi:hypothetical protein
MNEAWHDVMELCNNQKITEILKQAHSEGFTVPVPLHEIVENDMIVAQSEIAWPAQKIAIVTTEEDKLALFGLGWKVELISNIEIGQFLNWLRS